MVLLFRIVITVSLFFHAPHAPELRLMPYGSSVARYLHWMVRVLTLSVVLALALSFMLNRVAFMREMDMGGSLTAVALAQTVGLAFIVVLVMWGCIWLGFRRVPHLCEDDLDQRNLRFWRNYLFVLVGFVFARWLIGLFGVMWAVLILGLVVPGLKLMTAWINHFFDQSTAAMQETHTAEAQVILDAFNAAEAEGTVLEGEPQPEVPEFADPYATARPIVQRAARFVLLMSAVFLVACGGGRQSKVCRQ